MNGLNKLIELNVLNEVNGMNIVGLIEQSMYSIGLNDCIECMKSIESMVYGVGRDQFCAWNIWYGLGPCHWCEVRQAGGGLGCTTRTQ